jgi:hypothetical protein
VIRGQRVEVRHLGGGEAAQGVEPDLGERQRPLQPEPPRAASAEVRSAIGIPRRGDPTVTSAATR